MNELAIFVGNKLGKYISYDEKLSNTEKIVKMKKLIELYNLIYFDEDYDVLIKVIITAINEIIHRSKLIGFNKQELEDLKGAYNNIKSK